MGGRLVDDWCRLGLWCGRIHAVNDQVAVLCVRIRLRLYTAVGEDVGAVLGVSLVPHGVGICNENKISRSIRVHASYKTLNVHLYR